METRWNRRGFKYHAVAGRHLKLNELKEAAGDSGVHSYYLYKENIPNYPRPELHVFGLRHDTDQDGLWGIWNERGFMSPWGDGFLWWSLDVGPDEIDLAEGRLLEDTYPYRTRQQKQMQWNFLHRFATSPAFHSGSRLGSYRFSFPLEKVLKAYKDQFCRGAEPVMRVMETVLYKQEVMYAVLVHSPANQRLFKQYPLLTDHPGAVCCYRDGYFLWRPEAMCKTHGKELIYRNDLQQMRARSHQWRPEWYVWDNVAIAFHVGNQVLSFGRRRLRDNLTFCYMLRPLVTDPSCFDCYEEAEELVEELWPHYPHELETA